MGDIFIVRAEIIQTNRLFHRNLTGLHELNNKCKSFLWCPLLRLRQLRQSSVGAGSHPGHERLPDRHEAAEGAAEALQERQQTVLILALGSICSPC